MPQPSGASDNRSDRLYAASGWLGLCFAGAFAVLIVAPALLGAAFGPVPGLRWGDVVDLPTPVVLLPLAWLLLLAAAPGRPSVATTFAFVALAALWALGHGVHLAANAIGHVVETVEDAPSELVDLVYLLDEPVSHHVWHAGVIGLAALVVGRAVLRGAGAATAAAGTGAFVAAIAGGVLYGGTFFVMTVEGQTWPMGIAASALLAAVTLRFGWRRFRHAPLLALFAVAHVATLVLVAVWSAANGWTVPEFSEVGLI